MFGGIEDKILQKEQAWALNSIDLAPKYMWVISNANLDEANILDLTNIKKYLRWAGRVEIELDRLYN